MERARKMILVPEPPPETSQSKVMEVEEAERNTNENLYKHQVIIFPDWIVKCTKFYAQKQQEKITKSA